MALYREIRTEADLPLVDKSYEMDQVDFKARPGDKAYELAKDVAAFANVIGGVILVGAHADGDRLKTYAPMTQTKADNCRTAFNAAVKDRCHPAPRIDIVTLTRDSGFVVAVNVFPEPEQPVGVKVPVKKEPGEKIDDRAYLFPIRKGTGTDYLRPQELATIMIPTIRKAAIDLDRIPATDRTSITLANSSHSGQPNLNLSVKLTTLDPHSSVATFDTGRGVIELPLAAIGAVQHLGTGTWRVTVRGALWPIGNTYLWKPER